MSLAAILARLGVLEYRMTQAFITLYAAIAGIATADQSTFVFRPGGVTSGNVYATWPALVTAAAAVQGPRIVEFDDSLGGCVIPAGAWNFGSRWNVTFFGTGTPAGFGSTVISVLGTMIGPYRFIDVSLQYNGAVPCLDVPTRTQLFFDGTTTVTSLGAGFFARAGAGTTVCNAWFSGVSGLVSGNCFEVFGANSRWFLNALDGSVFLANTLANNGGTSMVAVSRSPAATVSLTQAGCPGGVLVLGSTFLMTSEAAQVDSTDAGPTVYGSLNVQGQLVEAARCLASFHAESGVIASIAAPTTLATLAAIDINAQESLVIDASMVVNKDATPGAVELLIEIDGVTVGPNLGTASTSVGANASCTIARTIQVKPAVGSRVVRIQAVAIAGDGSLLAGGATVIARRVLA